MVWIVSKISQSNERNLIALKPTFIKQNHNMKHLELDSGKMHLKSFHGNPEMNIVAQCVNERQTDPEIALR